MAAGQKWLASRNRTAGGVVLMLLWNSSPAPGVHRTAAADADVPAAVALPRPPENDNNEFDDAMTMPRAFTPGVLVLLLMSSPPGAGSHSRRSSRMLSPDTDLRASDVRETCRLQWDRQFAGQRGRASRIRYQLGAGRWREVDSPDELPENVRRLYDELQSRAADLADGTDAGPGSADSGLTRTRHIPHRRRPARAREIDRSLFLDHPWFSPGTLFCCTVTTGLFFWIAWTEFDQTAAGRFGSWAFTLLGAFFGYYSLCLLLNSTEFKVDDEWLSVRHGPLPWFGNRQLPVDRIQQISTRVHSSRHR
jgi:hypothetical protein